MTSFQKSILLIFFILLTMWFYWYQWRPVSNRSYCHDEAKTKANNILKIRANMTDVNIVERDNLLEMYQKGLHLTDDYNSYYEKCLHEKGLK